MTARLARITIYPVKALPGIDRSTARVLASGALEYDRRFAMLSADDAFINSKKSVKVHAIGAEFDETLASATFSRHDARSAVLSLNTDGPAIEEWLSAHLDQSVRWAENPLNGFPDDTLSPGPTIVSTATLAEVASWFPGMTVDEARRRFRANLEIEGVPAFWEDGFCSGDAQKDMLEIGGVQFACVNPCQRCVTPTRVPETGEPTVRFVQKFVEHREQTLPDWANRDRFDHFYRLAINTRLHRRSTEGVVRVGDAVERGSEEPKALKS